jgi:hypothetical protein
MGFFAVARLFMRPVVTRCVPSAFWFIMTNRISSQDATSVYVTVFGHICIEQQSFVKTKPNKVLVTPENVAQLCKALKSLQGEAVQAREDHWACLDSKESTEGSK